MRRHLPTLLVVVALAATGCGLAADPSVSTTSEVLDGLFRLDEGGTVRATAALELDQGEVRDVLRDDPEAQQLLQSWSDGEDGADLDTALADLEELQRQLEDHAVILAAGADQSGRIAVEHQGEVWGDLRFRVVPLDEDDPARGASVDLQTQVDWEVAAELFEQPGLLDELDTAMGRVSMLGDGPELEPLQQLVTGFLQGELVGLGGELDEELLQGLGIDPEQLSGAFEQQRPQDVLDIDPREAAETLFTFADYRRDGDLTLVDVSIQVRDTAELVLDALEEDPAALGATPEDLEQARSMLDELPEQLQDVATLRFDDSGTVAGMRIDVLDLAVQLARAADGEDAELATLERVASQLDQTGLFIDVAVDDVGELDTVLGDPSTTVSPEDLAAIAEIFLGSGPFGPAGGLGGLDGLPAAPDEGAASPAFGGAALTAGDVAVGDCFQLVDLPAEGPTVPCDQPHDSEAYATVAFDGPSYEAAFADPTGFEACEAAFVDFVGVDHVETELLFATLPPSPEQFDAGAREAVCYVFGPDPLVGSVAGTRG